MPPATRKVPKVVALDLDGTIWDPEMYQLYGGAPFKIKSPTQLADKRGESVNLHTGVFACFEWVKQSGAQMAIASSTDEPAWAKECLDKFALSSALDHVVIYKGNKQRHLREIAERAGVDLGDILFIDNQHDNIRHCQQIGVPSFITPRGLTIEAWHAALEYFAGL